MTRTSVYFSVSSVARNVSIKILVCGRVSYPPTGIILSMLKPIGFTIWPKLLTLHVAISMTHLSTWSAKINKMMLAPYIQDFSPHIQALSSH